MFESLKSIFSPIVLTKAADAVIDTGDALVYTDEERAKAYQKLLDTKLKMLPLFEPFKVAQRYLATIFSINFILAFWVGVLIFFRGNKEQFDGYIQLVSAFSLGWIMVAIVTFYFGGGFLNTIKKGK